MDELSDINIMIEDGASELRFGAATKTVRALPYARSIEWSKKVRMDILRKTNEDGGAIKNLQKACTKKGAGDAEAIAAFEQFQNSSVPNDVPLLAALVHAHSPDILTDEVLDAASQVQIIDAFATLFALENPTKPLQNAISMVIGTKGTTTSTH